MILNLARLFGSGWRSEEGECSLHAFAQYHDGDLDLKSTSSQKAAIYMSLHSLLRAGKCKLLNDLEAITKLNSFEHEWNLLTT
jgi:hypothetical protein